MKWLALGVVLALGGCSRDNPAFEGAEASSGETGGIDASSGSDEMPPVTTASASGSMSGSQDTDEPTGAVTEGSTSGPSTATETGSENVCPPHDDDNFVKIGLADVNGELMAMCPDGDRFFVGYIHNLGVDGSTIEILACPTSTCACADPESVFLNVEPDTFPVFGEDVCADVFAGTNDSDGLLGCEFASFAVRPQADAGPTVMGANALAIPAPWGGYDVAIEEDALCGDVDCDMGVNHPGRQKLQSSGDGVAETETADVSISGVSFSLTNRTAHVTPDCETHVAWYAIENLGG